MPFFEHKFVFIATGDIQVMFCKNKAENTWTTITN